MKFKLLLRSTGLQILILFWLFMPVANGQELKENPELDARVQKFLDSREGQWRDLNVPTIDGQILYNLIIENKLQSGLEIGTSTGHSAIWIAWAFSKTGGKLITVEINESRYKQALENFKEAGLSEYIDARLANAHHLVPELKGPFDFVFSDADKNWYKNYFIAVDPNLISGGFYVTHNVYYRDRLRSGNMAEYVNYLLNHPNYTTTFDDSGNGLSISIKK
ncbi:O-methyltransferase [Natronoflexus pectinivorans]|uniref:Putative O-methyltransferase YrrM n=1 Tax=Natronoflexus pectinivorans TaxID=682526 RepID=A0A4R2GH75_9BACT|nr:class I SAM-dependent methyltransferase [Natronoflexus pectinivorans]TCO07451.1 putative O-methyltransferase YrrM [Natronoflexus pectinivorans]